jgi:hypothetical protein
MRTIVTKDTTNLQVPGKRLTDKAMVKLVKEAEKGPFMTFDEHHAKMDKWIQENLTII